MKKIISGVLVAMLAVVLVACGAKEETKSFTLTQEGIESTLTYTYKSDKVTKQTTKSTIDYEAIGATDKEMAKSLLGPQSEQFQGIEGVEEKIDYKASSAVETLSIDYTKVDFDEISSLPGMTFSGDAKKKGVSMKATEKMLKDSNYKEDK